MSSQAPCASQTRRSLDSPGTLLNAGSWAVFQGLTQQFGAALAFTLLKSLPGGSLALILESLWPHGTAFQEGEAPSEMDRVPRGSGFDPWERSQVHEPGPCSAAGFYQFLPTAPLAPHGL